MLTYDTASSNGNVTVFRLQRENSCRQLFIHMCVSLRAFEFSVSAVSVNGHMGFSGDIVTLT